MKRLILFLLVVCSCIITWPHNTLLILNFNDNKESETFVLEELPTITFDGTGGIVFDVKGFQFRYLLNDLKSYVFYDVIFQDVSHVETLENDSHSEKLNRSFFLENNIVRFPLANYSRYIRLYTVEGVLCYSKQLDPMQDFVLDLNSFLRGIYVLNINNQALKIILR